VHAGALDLIADAPGKFAVVNIADAGSALTMPKEIVGTLVWLSSQTPTCCQEPPAATLCDPFVQLNVSPNSKFGAARFEGAELAVGFVRAAALLPQHALLSDSAKPF
jgi:hypothetical protein